MGGGGARRMVVASWGCGKEAGWYEAQWRLYTIVNTYECSALAVATEPKITLACTIRLFVGQAIFETN